MTFEQVIVSLLEGFELTVLLFFITLVLAIPLGLLMALGSISKFKPLKWLMKVIIWIIRGTPLMLQIVVVSFIPSYVFQVQNKQIADFFGTQMANVHFLFCVVAFVINYAAYFSEIIRGGIEGISKGQREACTVLGLTKRQTFVKVILPQVIKRIVPPMGNEIITLVKDTALARALGVAEIIKNAQNAVNITVSIWPLFYAGIFYLIFNGVITILLKLAEKKLDYYRG